MTEEEMRELHHFEVEQILSEIQEVIKPEWIHGKVLQQYLGSEEVARFRAIKAIMERWEG